MNEKNKLAAWYQTKGTYTRHINIDKINVELTKL